jgi:proteasome lid subunit RPN8/RPN11
LRLVLPAELQQLLVGETKAALPHECCGLLIGAHASDCIEVSDIAISDNLADDPSQSFEIDMRLRLRFQKELRGTSKSVIGHYHSHPNGRVGLSGTDKAQAWEDQMVWLVIAAGEETFTLSADLYDAAAQTFQSLVIAAEQG